MRMSYEELAVSLIEARTAAEARAAKRVEEIARLRAEVEPKMRALCSAFRAHRICRGCPAFVYSRGDDCNLNTVLGNNPELIADFLKKRPNNGPFESATIIAITEEKERLDKSYGGAE